MEEELKRIRSKDLSQIDNRMFNNFDKMDTINSTLANLEEFQKFLMTQIGNFQQKAKRESPQDGLKQVITQNCDTLRQSIMNAVPELQNSRARFKQDILQRSFVKTFESRIQEKPEPQVYSASFKIKNSYSAKEATSININPKPQKKSIKYDQKIIKLRQQVSSLKQDLQILKRTQKENLKNLQYSIQRKCQQKVTQLLSQNTDLRRKVSKLQKQIKQNYQTIIQKNQNIRNDNTQSQLQKYIKKSNQIIYEKTQHNLNDITQPRPQKQVNQSNQMICEKGQYIRNDSDQSKPQKQVKQNGRIVYEKIQHTRNSSAQSKHQKQVKQDSRITYERRQHTRNDSAQSQLQKQIKQSNQTIHKKRQHNRSDSNHSKPMTPYKIQNTPNSNSIRTQYQNKKDSSNKYMSESRAKFVSPSFGQVNNFSAQTKPYLPSSLASSIYKRQTERSKQQLQNNNNLIRYSSSSNVGNIGKESLQSTSKTLDFEDSSKCKQSSMQSLTLRSRQNSLEQNIFSNKLFKQIQFKGQTQFTPDLPRPLRRNCVQYQSAQTQQHRPRRAPQQMGLENQVINKRVQSCSRDRNEVSNQKKSNHDLMRKTKSNFFKKSISNVQNLIEQKLQKNIQTAQKNRRSGSKQKLKLFNYL